MKYNPLKTSAKCRNDENCIYFIQNSAVHFLLHKGGENKKGARSIYFYEMSTKKYFPHHSKEKLLKCLRSMQT